MALRPTQNCLDILRCLIAFDTTSRNSNLELMDYVKALLDEQAIPFRLTYDDYQRKANLLATLGPTETPGGYVLSGHTDVVPVDRQDWETDPFNLTEIDGKLYGRGTTDMKSFIAIVLAALPELKRRKLKVPVYIALSYDEEVGLIGVHRLITDMSESGFRPASCIVGEPTSMRIVTSHKGKRSYRCRVRGTEAHSSLAPTGVNAVEYAGAVVAYLQKLARRFRTEGPFDEEYDCAHTTVHVGTIRGGTALNIVPAECTLEFEFRHLPGDNPDKIFSELKAFVGKDLLPEMQAVHPDAGIEFEPMSVIPSLDTDEDADITQLAKAITGDNGIQKVSYNCEACLFDEAGVQTIICGPGDIDQAHKPNEFIEIDQISKCETFVEKLMDRICETT